MSRRKVPNAASEASGRQLEIKSIPSMSTASKVEEKRYTGEHWGSFSELKLILAHLRACVRRE